ncbi:unnamed protein product [Psylliodes chrysocephalus]|uniref:E3 ubiquitin-protein ligase n=1 Tax=Psylliodes chrysocephalus TaxID=3402493 RepID=A0A9P0DCB7_9CUCU|nr:unnamed protein product [Psylliodes chrysocephala]
MLHDDLLEDLECPICCEYLIPPIRMCNTGHSICNQCREKISICPMCSSTFSTGRNVTLESVANKIKYPCEYRRYGCTEKMDLSERIPHQKKCSYKIIKCPKENCKFVGVLNDLINHCWENHEILNVDTRSDISYFFLTHDSLSNSYLLRQYDSNKFIYFWLRAKIVCFQVYLSIQMLAEPKEASKYNYQIQFTDGIRTILYSDTCQSIFVDDEDLFKISESCSLSMKSYLFYSKSESFRKTITIEKPDKNKNYSWFYLFILLVLIFCVFQYYFYPIYHTVFSIPSVSDSKVDKVKTKHKSKKHYKHLDDDDNNNSNINTDFTYEDWIILIFFILPVLFSFILVFKTLRRILTFIRVEIGI